MKYYLFTVGICFSFFLEAQQSILVYDLSNLTVDTLQIPPFDSTLTEDHTPHHLGSFNSQVEVLPTTIPTMNVYPNTNFTYKKRASLVFDVEKYPLRTSVKLFGIYNDTLGHLCSGSMISSKHVLTATHCLFTFNSNTLINDSLRVYPAYDNGQEHFTFGYSEVEKIIIFSNWGLNTNDIAILELKDPLGVETGWISIGYNKNDTALAQGLFYKFPYPALTNLAIDSTVFNGDTMFFNYGEVDLFDQTRVGITGVTGSGGESGSSIIKIENGQKYISYGVLSFALNLTHSRINQLEYYGLRSIIADDLSVPGFPGSGVSELIVFPNPSQGEITLRLDQPIRNGRVTIHNLPGQQLSSQNIDSDSPHVQLPQEAGIYVLTLWEGEELIGRTKVVRE